MAQSLAEPAAYRVAPNDAGLLRCVESIALRTDRPFSPLKLQALLQLPRLADNSGLVERLTAASLIEDIANELPAAPCWKAGAESIDSLHSLRFGEVSADEAEHIMRTFHYLRSPRIDGRAYGLSAPSGAIIALAVSSPLDVGTITALLRNENRVGPARVIARVFAFENAPKNSISYLLARTSSRERCVGTTDLVTYVNPNMGFNGVSYRASGWTLLGDEPGTKYKYLDGRYITDRQLIALLGTNDEARLTRTLRARFASSSMQLLPLLLYRTEIGNVADRTRRRLVATD